MKALKEPLSRIANTEDKTRGSFWQNRFKSVAVLDDEALLTISAYVDLNVVAVGKATLPDRLSISAIGNSIKPTPTPAARPHPIQITRETRQHHQPHFKNFVERQPAYFNHRSSTRISQINSRKHRANACPSPPHG